MGCNYFLRNECEHCGRHDDVHIGKSSAGWCFTLNIHPDLGINTLDDWVALIKTRTKKEKIVDEYGGEILLDELLKIITERTRHGSDQPLLRHTVDGILCVGHSEGTWDYLVGEFS